MEKQIIGLVAEKGPLTGSEILESLGADPLLVWRTCRLSKNLLVKRVGTRFLRLDRRVEGLARLSPSILREFLTYCAIGLPGEVSRLENRAKTLASHIHEVSRAKSELAFSVVSALASRFESVFPILEHASFILAGDIVYNMAHDVPRPERSTGKLVKGSDLDLVVVVDRHVPERIVKRLDDAIYQEKYRLLITPHIREEIDYTVKNMDRIRVQLAFDTYKHMVACKIMHEGTLLYGSEELFHEIKMLLKEHGIPEKLGRMEKEAQEFRKSAEQCLLLEEVLQPEENHAYLFYPAEESEEFE